MDLDYGKNDEIIDRDELFVCSLAYSPCGKKIATWCNINTI